MKRTSLHRFIPVRFAILVAPLTACWPQASYGANGLWNGATAGTWHTVTGWTPNTSFPGEATAAVTGEGLGSDIASFTGTNISANVGINLNMMGGQLSLGAIDFARTMNGNLQIGNNSTMSPV